MREGRSIASTFATQNYTMGLHREDTFAVKYLCLILGVTPEHIRTTSLEIPGCNQDHIAILDPGTPLHLAAYPTDSVGPVLTLHHYPIVPKHLGYNPKQLARFWKNELINIPFREDPFLSQSTLPILQGECSTIHFNLPHQRTHTRSWFKFRCSQSRRIRRVSRVLASPRVRCFTVENAVVEISSTRTGKNPG